MTESEIVTILFMTFPIDDEMTLVKEMVRHQTGRQSLLESGAIKAVHNDNMRSEGLKISKFHCLLIV